MSKILREKNHLVKNQTTLYISDKNLVIVREKLIVL